MLGFSVVAGDNDHFRRQLVLELVRQWQQLTLTTWLPGLTFPPLCLIRLAKPDPATLPYQAQEIFTALPVQDRTGG